MVNSLPVFYWCNWQECEHFSKAFRKCDIAVYEDIHCNYPLDAYAPPSKHCVGRCPRYMGPNEPYTSRW